MSLNIAVQMDPIQRINIKGDSTFALLLEAQKRDTSLAITRPTAAMLNGQVFSTVETLHVRDQADDHFKLDTSCRAPLAEFDVILLRQTRPSTCPTSPARIFWSVSIPRRW